MDVKSALSVPEGRVGDNGREQVSDSIVLQLREEFHRSASTEGIESIKKRKGNTSKMDSMYTELASETMARSQPLSCRR